MALSTYSMQMRQPFSELYKIRSAKI